MEFIYGAGIIGSRILELLKTVGIRVWYILDDAWDKWGTKIEGICRTPEEFMSE